MPSKHIWVTSKNQDWAASELGISVEEVKNYYEEARRLGIKCSVTISDGQATPVFTSVLREKYQKHGTDPTYYSYVEWCGIYSFLRDASFTRRD